MRCSVIERKAGAQQAFSSSIDATGRWEQTVAQPRMCVCPALDSIQNHNAYNEVPTFFRFAWAFPTRFAMTEGQTLRSTSPRNRALDIFGQPACPALILQRVRPSIEENNSALFQTHQEGIDLPGEESRAFEPVGKLRSRRQAPTRTNGSRALNTVGCCLSTSAMPWDLWSRTIAYRRNPHAALQ